MGKRVLVVGGVAGGASAAARVRRLDAEASITVFERGEHVSFSNCSLPYFLSRTVGDAESLVLMTPEGFKASYDIDVRINNEVCAIDRAAKKIRVRNELTGIQPHPAPVHRRRVSPPCIYRAQCERHCEAGQIRGPGGKVRRGGDRRRLYRP